MTAEHLLSGLGRPPGWNAAEASRPGGLGAPGWGNGILLAPCGQLIVAQANSPCSLGPTSTLRFFFSAHSSAKREAWPILRVERGQALPSPSAACALASLLCSPPSRWWVRLAGLRQRAPSSQGLLTDKFLSCPEGAQLGASMGGSWPGLGSLWMPAGGQWKTGVHNCAKVSVRPGRTRILWAGLSPSSPSP